MNVGGAPNDGGGLGVKYVYSSVFVLREFTLVIRLTHQQYRWRQRSRTRWRSWRQWTLPPRRRRRCIWRTSMYRPRRSCTPHLLSTARHRRPGRLNRSCHHPRHWRPCGRRDSHRCLGSDFQSGLLLSLRGNSLRHTGAFWHDL